MTLARRALLAAMTTVACLTATNLKAVVQPASALADKIYRHPSLHIPHELRSLAQLPPGLASNVEQDLAALGLGADSAFYDARAGRLTSLIVRVPLVPGTGVGNTLQRIGDGTAGDAAMREAAWAGVLGYLRRHEAVLRVDVAELGNPRIAVHEHGSLIQAYAPRMMNGIPVRDASVTAIINHGNLVLLGLDNWGDGFVAAAAQIGADQARSAVGQHAQPFLVENFPKDANLEYIPMVSGGGYDFRLAWVVRATVQGDGGTWEGLVDAVSGELIAFEDKNQYVARNALGGVYPVSNDQVSPDGLEQPGWPMPFLNVATPGGPITTNAGGTIGCVAGAISTALSGRYTTMIDVCGAANETAAAGDLDLGFGPTATATDCQVPAGHSAGDTKASRTGMYELTRINEQARGYLPANAWLNSALPSNMNINNVCNAFWSGSGRSVNFYRDNGSACRNTGEIAGFIDHEWGHGMDANGVNPNIANPGEGIADLHSSLRLNDSCMGRGFFKGNVCGGYGDPCTVCTGARDSDWARRVSGAPHGIPWIDANCDGGPAPCGGEVHCEGAVVGESGWDLSHRDFRGFAGSVFNYDHNTALELTTRLFYIGSGPVVAWFQCTNPNGGCQATGGYMNLLAVDDDNGDLTDGTPHMTAIFAAFDRHNIACATPAPVNSGCATGPTAAPVLAAAPQDQGAVLTWGAVPNATRYYVYRTEGVNTANFGKVKIAELTGTTFVDTNLQNGRTYFFNVLPVGANLSCFGLMSNSVTVVPATGANLAIRPVVSVVISGGDGDDILDNCETATLDFTVENTGTGTLTNVRVVAVVPITHPATILNTPLPSTLAASLADCAIATGSVSVRPQGMSFDETTQIRIDVTADELGGQLRSVIASITGVESDFQTVATRTYTFNGGMDGWTVANGTFNRVETNPGSGDFYLASSTCLDNQCDIVRSPMVRLLATSTLSLQQRYDTETPVPTPYDRANVGIFDIGANTRTVVSPNGGDVYDLLPGAANGTCETTLQAGWAADTDADCTANAAFLTSTWTAAALNPGGIFTGRSARLSLHYGTDFSVVGYGFHFDNVTLTNFQEPVPDVQPNTCGSCTVITVNPPTIPAGTAGTAYSQTFTQTGGGGTITWSVTGTLPAGITLDTSTGVLSGTPAQTGSFPITVTATDGNGCGGGRGYTLVIGCQTITVNPATIPAGTAGSAYSQTFTQASGIGTITWSVTGALPTGITLNASTGVLSGTPTQAGSFPITVRVTDANGCFGARAYTLVIGCQTITVNPATIPAGIASAPYSQTFTQTSGIGTITWSLTGTLPTGITFNAPTGVLSGTPAQIGSFPITVTATDANGCIGTGGYTLGIGPAGPFVPTALNVDAAGNRVFEPGETVVVAPSWRNDTGAPQAVTGAATNFIGPGTPIYTISDATASYGTVAAGGTATCSSGGDCYGFGVSVANSRPTLHWDSTFVETMSSSEVKTWRLHIGASFTDVPTSSGFYRFVETILHKNVTGGCTATAYCPANSTTREQMAVFVLVSREPAGYTPPACGATPMFSDVPASSTFCRWIEELARRGVVGGCAAGLYCPSNPATREQMAVFVLRTLDPALNPPACGTPVFSDVSASSPFCRWIEELVRRGVVTGCGGGYYCPTANVSREQMGVFLTLTFGLALYGL